MCPASLSVLRSASVHVVASVSASLPFHGHVTLPRVNEHAVLCVTLVLMEF